MIVAIDTSSALSSVALLESGSVLAEREHLDPRRHAEMTAPLLAELLREFPAAPTEVQFIACGVGPGPYTGLRVGIATALSLGLAWERPVIGLCSLDAIAEEAVFGEPAARRGDAFSVAIDARRSEVYWAEYDPLGARISGPLVTKWDDLIVSNPSRSFIGPHDVFPRASWVAHRVERLTKSGVAVTDIAIDLDVHGSNGSATAAALAGAQLLPPMPLYLRRPDVMEPKP